MAQLAPSLAQVPGQAAAKASAKTSAAASDNARRLVGISAAALLLGGGTALALFPKRADAEPGTLGTTPTAPQLPANIAEAHSVTDSMPFGEAFAAARAEVGPGGAFVWHGQPYNTFLRDEWTSLSLSQRQEYAEMVLDAHLPINIGGAVRTQPTHDVLGQPTTDTRPTLIEGHLADHRVMGIDDDNDGVIDTLVVESDEGYQFRVIDGGGDQGLDTLYGYDAIADDYRLMYKLDQPLLLTNEQLSENLEEAMAKQIVNDILNDEPVSTAPTPESIAVADAIDDDLAEADSDDNFDTNFGGSYINDGDVDDMDHPAHAHGVE